MEGRRSAGPGVVRNRTAWQLNGAMFDPNGARKRRRKPVLRWLPCWLRPEVSGGATHPCPPRLLFVGDRHRGQSVDNSGGCLSRSQGMTWRGTLALERCAGCRGGFARPPRAELPTLSPTAPLVCWGPAPWTKRGQLRRALFPWRTRVAPRWLVDSLLRACLLRSPGPSAHAETPAPPRDRSVRPPAILSSRSHVRGAATSRARPTSAWRPDAGGDVLQPSNQRPELAASSATGGRYPRRSRKCLRAFSSTYASALRTSVGVRLTTWWKRVASTRPRRPNTRFTQRAKRAPKLFMPFASFSLSSASTRKCAWLSCSE